MPFSLTGWLNSTPAPKGDHITDINSLRIGQRLTFQQLNDPKTKSKRDAKRKQLRVQRENRYRNTSNPAAIAPSTSKVPRGMTFRIPFTLTVAAKTYIENIRRQGNDAKYLIFPNLLQDGAAIRFVDVHGNFTDCGIVSERDIRDAKGQDAGFEKRQLKLDYSAKDKKLVLYVTNVTITDSE